MSKCEVEREREREKECRTETALPARGLSGLQAAEQWQETSVHGTFPFERACVPLIQGLVAPRRPAVNGDVTLCWVVGACHRQNREGGRVHVNIFY